MFLNPAEQESQSGHLCTLLLRCLVSLDDVHSKLDALLPGLRHILHH